MIAHPAPAPALPTGAMATIAALLERRTGQQIAPGRAWRLEATLTPMLRHLGMATLDDLVNGLVDSRDGALSDTVVDALLNQETSFFRDAPVFETMADVVATAGSRARIWCAGASTGQEPLSLAMLLEERGLAAEIIATDVSHGAVARAKAARYSQFEIQRGLSVGRMMRWFESDGGDWIARRDLVRRVLYRRQHLVDEPPPSGSFDLILCRNVLFYFTPDRRGAALVQIARALRPGGVLVLGAGETVLGQTSALVPCERWRGGYTHAG